MLAAALVLAAAASPAFGQEDPSSWPQFQGGPGHPGGLEGGPQPPYRIGWTLVAPDDGTLSGVAIAGDVAVTVGGTAVYGVDLETGDVSWEAPRAGGPLSVPAVAAGATTSVLFTEGPPAEDETPTGTPSGSPTATPTASPPEDAEAESPDSFLVAIDAEDQTERWRVPLEATSRTGVAVADDTAYVGDDAGNVYAVSLEDGALRWSVNAGDAVEACPAADAGRMDVPIAVADGRVIAVSRDTEQGSVLVTALAVADGACVWRRAPQVGQTSTSAAAAGGGLVVVGLPDRYVRGLDGETGDPRWSSLALKTFWPSSAPALRSDALYVSDYSGGLYRFDPADGSRVWGFQFNELSYRSSPVVSGDVVLLGLDDGRLVAVDADSSHLVWEGEATPGAIGTLALSGDLVVATKGGPDAGLVAFEPDPDGSRIDVPSPTELRPGTTLSRIAAAAVVVLAVVLAPGLLLRRRLDVRVEAEEEEPDDVDDDGEDEGS